MEPGEDFEFAATFEVYPPVDLAPLARIDVKRPRAQIVDADVDKMIESLREQRKHWHAVDRAAADGDRVTVDFKGSIDDVLFDGGTGENVAFVIGAKQMIDDFDRGVRGAKTGDQVTFDATFPADYRVETLAGKTARFDVTVKEVAQAHVPELDETFFKAFGIAEGGYDEFRAEVVKNMQRELDDAVRNQLKRQVMDELKRLHEVQLPQAMVKREIGALKQQMAQQMQSYTQPNRDALMTTITTMTTTTTMTMITITITTTDHDQGVHGCRNCRTICFRGEAERRVKVGLVVNELITAHGLKADPARVRQRVEDIASTYVQPEQVINWYYSNEAQLSQIEMAVLEDQVVDHILDNASVE